MPCLIAYINYWCLLQGQGDGGMTSSLKGDDSEEEADSKGRRRSKVLPPKVSGAHKLEYLAHALCLSAGVSSSIITSHLILLAKRAWAAQWLWLLRAASAPAGWTAVSCFGVLLLVST
jgi:hypothetical protein